MGGNRIFYWEPWHTIEGLLGRILFVVLGAPENFFIAIPFIKIMLTLLWNVKRGFLTFARLDLEIPAILQPGGTRKLQGESVHLWNLTSPKFMIDTKSDGLETVSQVSTHYKVSPYKRYKWSSYNPYNFPILSRVTTWGYNEPPI